MVSRKAGIIVNISSAASYWNFKEWALYSASKACWLPNVSLWKPLEIRLLVHRNSAEGVREFWSYYSAPLPFLSCYQIESGNQGLILRSRSRFLCETSHQNHWIGTRNYWIYLSPNTSSRFCNKKRNIFSTKEAS